MALQRVSEPAPLAQTGQGQPGSTGPAAQAAPTSPGPALSTRETTSRPFVELGVMFGQALGGREPVMQALTNLQAIGQEHGCDAIIAVKLLHYPTTSGPAVVAYGTGVRFVPPPGHVMQGPIAVPAAAPIPPEQMPPEPAVSDAEAAAPGSNNVAGGGQAART